MKLGGWLALIGLPFLVGSFVTWAIFCTQPHDTTKIRELEAAIAWRDSVLFHLKEEKHLRDTIYAADTVTMTKWRLKYQTLRDTLELTDTLAVITVIDRADSTITACQQIVRSCDDRVAAREAIIQNRDAQIKTYAQLVRELQPPRLTLALAGTATLPWSNLTPELTGRLRLPRLPVFGEHTTLDVTRRIAIHDSLTGPPWRLTLAKAISLR